MARKHTWGEVYEPLVEDQWPHNPICVENSHERPFTIIPKANTYGFLTKKWSFMAIFDKNGGFVAIDHRLEAHTPHPTYVSLP